MLKKTLNWVASFKWLSGVYLSHVFKKKHCMDESKCLPPRDFTFFCLFAPYQKYAMHTHTQFLNNFPSFHPSRAFTNHFRCCLFIDNEMFAPWLFCFLAKVQTSHSSSGTSSSNQAMRFGEDPIRCIEYADTRIMTEL